MIASAEDGSSADADGARQEAIYQEQILAHFRRPHGRGVLTAADTTATARNPLCGEEIAVSITMAEDPMRIGVIRFVGEGCSLATASASIMTDIVPGRTEREIAQIADRLRRLVSGEREASDLLPPPLRVFAPVARVPARRACVLLPWDALQAALVARLEGVTGRRT